MKTKLTVFLAAVLLVTGCDLIKDAAEVEFSTDLTAVIPVVAPAKKAGNALAEVNASNFSQSYPLELADNVDIEPYLEKIREINLQSLQVTVNGLTEGQIVNTLTLSVAGVGTVFTRSNITPANNSFTPEIESGILGNVGNKLKNDRMITLTVAGTASNPMAFTVNLTFDAGIVAGALD